MSLTDVTGPVERYLRQALASELDRQRFDRAKRFVDETVRSGGEAAHRMSARWLKFLCSRTPVQRGAWPEDADFLRHVASVIDLPSAERRTFLGLSLLGRLWRTLSFPDLANAPPDVVARLTRVTGWEHFEQSRKNATGLILLPVHSQFARLMQPYLRYRGHEGIEVGLTRDKLERKGAQTSVAKQFELARQMHAAKQLLDRGGIVFNPPDARQNLDNSRWVEFFGRQRQLATGFAELALKTGADVVPLAYRFSPRGSFDLEFGVPLSIPPAHLPHDERVAALVEQYANFLRNEWRYYLWNIAWNHLLHFLLLPEAGAGAIDAKATAPDRPETTPGGTQSGLAR